MRRTLAAIVGFPLAINGMLMLFFPLAWYHAVPGVTATGPFNPHFVRDIGCAFLASGGALAWFWLDARARLAAMAGATFLTRHALVHLWDLAAGRESSTDLGFDLLAIFLPAMLALWAVWPKTRFQKESSDAQMAAAASDRRVRTHL
jgi:uncharacterized protein YjeT (DUF2065 family)